MGKRINVKNNNKKKKKQTFTVRTVVHPIRFSSKKEMTKYFIKVFSLTILLIVSVIIIFAVLTNLFLILQAFFVGITKILLTIASIPLICNFNDKIKKRIKKNNFIKKIKKSTLIKGIVNLVYVSLISSIILFNIPCINAWSMNSAQKIHTIIGDSMNETSALEEPIVPNTYNNDNINFIINHENLSNELSDDFLSAAYLYSQQDKDVLTYFNEIYQSETPISSANNYMKIQEIEDIFLQRINVAKNHKQVNGADEKWQELLPCENDLLKIIAQQKKYAEEYPTFLVYQRLSNNYQRLALEYLQQSANESTIKYYYCQSLLCDYNSIKYAQNTQDYETALNRIYYRYQDIYTNCELSYDEANHLSSLMKQLDDYT